MQVLKSNTNKNILKAARDLFLKNGFTGVSMREISTTSGVGLSNIYNYYTNKDELFVTVVKPATDALYSLLDNNKESNFIDIFDLNSEKNIHKYINLYSQLIKKHHTELKILFHKASGSSLHNFKYDFTRKSVEIVRNSLEILAKREPGRVDDISDFSLNMHYLFKTSFLEEIVKHDDLYDDLENIIYEYVRLEVSGWKNFIK